MIQRIQSIYLLIVAVLGIVMMSLPIGHFITPDKSPQIFEMGALVIVNDQKQVVSGEPWLLFLLLQAITLIALITIFLFKKRALQVRLSVINVVLLIVYFILMLTFIFTLKGDNSFIPSWTVFLPLIAIILNWLAIRAIAKDEKLVKSYDHLR